MNTREKWLKFVLTGSAVDYVNFSRSREKDIVFGSDFSAFYRKCSCDKRSENEGAGQACDSSYIG